MVRRFEPKTRQVHEGDDGKMRILLDVQNTPAGGGTRMDMEIDLRPRWFVAPMIAVLWPFMLRRRVGEALEASAANVKRIVELGDTAG